MAPRVPPSPVVKHESIALIGAQTPPQSLQPDPDAKTKHPSLIEPQVVARWLRIPVAVRYSGINRSRLFRLIAEGAIKTACLKEHRGARRGLRLVDKFSLDLFLETLSKPVEERLVFEFNELLVQQQELTKQQDQLAQKQRAVQQQLTKIRKRPDAA